MNNGEYNSVIGFLFVIFSIVLFCSRLEHIIIRMTASDIRLHLNITLIASALSLPLLFLPSSRLSSSCFHRTAGQPLRPLLPLFSFFLIYIFSLASIKLLFTPIASYIYFFSPHCLVKFFLPSLFCPSSSFSQLACNSVQ